MTLVIDGAPDWIGPKQYADEYPERGLAAESVSYVRVAVLRTDFRAFAHKVFTTLSPGQSYIPTWHVEAIAWRLERVRRGEARRLILNMPPRSLKSITASVAFPAFALGHDPSRRIICVSYSADLDAGFPTPAHSPTFPASARA